MPQPHTDLEQLEIDRKFVMENDWMIRPCLVYELEYKDCSSLKGRFYQYYRDGHLADCNEWYNNEKDCKKYVKRDDFAAGSRIIKDEMKRLDNRIQLHKNNDIWPQRKQRPPPNWFAPLPEHLQSKTEASYFVGREEELKAPLGSKKSMCVIS